MIRNKTIVIVLLIIVLVAGAAFSQNKAVVKRILGKVEIQRPGEAWIPAAVGMELPLRATISTGFNSQAVLEIGKSVLTLRALTRIRIDELQVRDNVAVTGLSMPVGRIRAEVRSTEGLSTDFRVRSPVSTAAVRGTGFDGDGSIFTCFDDSVDLINQGGIPTKVYKGETGKIAGLGRPSGGAPQRLQNTTIYPYSGGSGGQRRGSRILGYKDELGRGRIVVNWTWE
jgi:hypothetical protein